MYLYHLIATNECFGCMPWMLIKQQLITSFVWWSNMFSFMLAAVSLSHWVCCVSLRKRERVKTNEDREQTKRACTLFSLKMLCLPVDFFSFFFLFSSWRRVNRIRKWAICSVLIFVHFNFNKTQNRSALFGVVASANGKFSEIISVRRREFESETENFSHGLLMFVCFFFHFCAFDCVFVWMFLFQIAIGDRFYVKIQFALQQFINKTSSKIGMLNWREKKQTQTNSHTARIQCLLRWPEKMPQKRIHVKGFVIY